MGFIKISLKMMMYHKSLNTNSLISEMVVNKFGMYVLQLHGGMYRDLSVDVCKLLRIFPALEAARPRSKSGIQALCSLHAAVEKAKGLLQHCSNCSKLYLVN